MLQPGEEQQILAFLSATQTPETAGRKDVQMASASPTGRGPARPPANSPYDGKTIGFLSFVCLAVGALVVRRPGTRTPPAPPAAPARVAAAAARPQSGPFLLELVRITQQGPDAKTLRFAVRSERKPEAQPGQFLTFTFLFAGKKVTRCYSICSSPARSAYVEITPKRVPNGCVSVFLNDSAALGMTVEATGPFGTFVLDPASDRKIVLLAAGSGITPLIAMLRFIDDMNLDIEATLLYCVRTAEDILFHEELEDLQADLKCFRYHVILSKAGADWPGDRGHLNAAFVRRTVPETEGRAFFLCGPPPFMETARNILVGLNVPPERIRQETFGGAGAPPKPPAAESGAKVEFARSGRSGTLLEGQSLLEAAAAAGVEIPSACRQGQCGTCKTRLLGGEVQMATEVGLDPESKDRGYVLTCVGRAVGNVKLDA